MFSLSPVVILIILNIQLFVHGVDHLTIYNLKNALLKNYSDSRRPVLDKSTVTNIHHASMFILHVEKLNEKEQTVKLHGLLSMSWTDEYLKWEPSEYNDTQNLLLDSWDIWLPNVVVVNTASQSGISRYWNLPVKVWSNGMVIGSSEFALDISCVFDFSDYPYDQQSCKIGVYVLDILPWRVKFQFVSNPLIWLYWPGLNNKTQISKWKLTNVSRIMKFWNQGELLDADNLTASQKEFFLQIIEYKLDFKRNDIYFKWTITLPVIMTSLLTILSLCPFVGFKLSMNVMLMNFILQCFYMDNLLDSLPPTVNGVPSIVIYYGFNMCATCLAIILRILLFHFEMKCTHKEENVKDFNEHDENHEQPTSVESAKPDNLNFISQHFDKFIFVILFLYIFSYIVCAVVNL